ncbi:MAG: hypothetical protein NTX64_10690 [Elusimicrobia bacterium]|nr:hypothetical protein [Elusimicrobiota bacterium]
MALLLMLTLMPLWAAQPGGGSGGPRAGARELRAPASSTAAVDGLGAPVSVEAQAQYAELLAAHKGRRLSEVEKSFILTVLNIPQLPSEVYKDRPALIRHFLKKGVRLDVSRDAGFAATDLWRLVRATRAAAENFDIPSALLMCLTFRESSFDPRASGWTTSAKGVAQLTNDTVAMVISRLRADPTLWAQTEAYARQLGASMPAGVEGAPDVDALAKEIRALQASGAPASEIAAKQRAKRRAVLSHKDEHGHIFNLETNFGLGAAYLAYMRRDRFTEVTGERRGWLTAVAAYNQGAGPVNELIHKVFHGAKSYNAAPLREIFSKASIGRLDITPEFREELYWEVHSVDRCSAK